VTSPRQSPTRDLDSAPWWSGTDARALLVQRCSSCGRLRWPARPICNDCHAFAFEWVAASGCGTIESWTVTHHSFGPTVEVPFVVVLVRLDDQDDIHMPGYYDGPGDGSTVRIGQAVRAHFVSVGTADGGGFEVVQWRPASPPDVR
jgi:uncharacterized OB-fold protein